jgi:hypothetical protein
MKILLISFYTMVVANMLMNAFKLTLSKIQKIKKLIFNEIMANIRLAVYDYHYLTKGDAYFY